MKCIILAAGFCTRLFPITEYFPKGLLSVKGKTILSYVLDEVVQLKEIDQIALVTNHRYVSLFATWLKTAYPQKNITIIDNGVDTPEMRLGAIGDLEFTRKKLKWNDDILVLASDTISTLRISDFLAFFAKHPGVTTALFQGSDIEVIRKKLSSVVVKGDSIIRFTEKPAEPESLLISLPYYIYPRSVLPQVAEYIKSGGSVDAPGSIIAWFIDKTPCFGYTFPGFYYDVGTIEIYNKLNSQKGSI